MLVGIDAYPSPTPPLRGCLKDVAQIEAYLQASIDSAEQLQLLSLCNEEATYPKIIDAFRQHLQQAGSEDVIWFHFSGHGTESYTAGEFQETIEPNGKDQNLVCYEPEGASGPHLLADKELAILLHEVATASGGEPPHMIVSLDCCHSGSGTRFDEWEPSAVRPRMISQPKFNTYKQALEAGKARALDSYLDGYFGTDNLHLPLTEHILFSACTSIQTAGDTEKGGIFTTGLVEALRGSNGPLNYADLFVRTRAAVQRQRVEQLPQFETIGGFDPYRQFLSGTPLGDPDQYELFKEGANWMIRCGAIHGLPARPEHPIKIKVLGLDGPDVVGVVASVGAQKSSIALPQDHSLKEDAFYQARLTYLPQPPVQVLLNGEQSAMDRLVKVWDDTAGLRWLSAAQGQSDAPELAVEADANGYRILDQRLGKAVFAVSEAPEMEHLVFNNLTKMMRWERVLALANKKSQILDRLSLELEVLLDQQQKRQFSAPELSLRTQDLPFIQHQGNQLLGFLPKVKISDTSQQLFCYLFHLRGDYSIQSYEGGYIFRPFEHPGKSEVILPLLKTHKGWGMGPDDAEATSYFKLFVTTEELDYHQLLQSGLGGERDAAWNWAPVGVSDDWCTLMIKVNVQRT